MTGLVLKNVVEISLESCRCERLPPLGKLTSLKILKISSMDSLKYFNHESYGDGEDSFPALEILNFNVMPSLEKWTIVDREEIFPCLRNLHIEACPKLTEFPFLRTLEILTIWEGSNERLIRSVINVTSLSDLEILGSELKILPDKLFSNFKHLRFLNMSYSYIKTLPESISGLQHLQTLKLNYCEEICKLPKRLKHMRNLTCLDIKGCDSLTSMPANMGQLTCLQRLSIFIVGQDEGYQISELKELNLGGELSIKELENVRNSEDAKRANLKSKLDLISLNLCWSDSNKESIPKNVEEILENL
ncbi:putative disease resistance protein RGA3 [Camellia sinensis]|uniref:putative disease resistance protein RGA3 n=1 Tax=Camellia sinensis TaxID=4442 RepID=UPI001035961E|nr:putative disease resistance protein RGA3 [Camellia sinensis]